jgi:hypothetical protein
VYHIGLLGQQQPASGELDAFGTPRRINPDILQDSMPPEKWEQVFLLFLRLCQKALDFRTNLL